MSQYAHYAVGTPEVNAAVAKLPPIPQFEDIHSAREGFGKAFDKVQEQQEVLLPPATEYTVRDHKVPVDGGEILVRSVVPTPKEGEDGTYPLLVWYHGGGWVLGDLRSNDFFLRELAVNQRVASVNVEYRLAPEFPFPTGHNDGYAALRWAAENPSLLGASLDKGFIVSGCSAGGNLAGSVALRSAEDPFFEGRRLTGQILQIPSVINHRSLPEKYKSQLLSLEEYKDGPILTKYNMEKFSTWFNAPPEHTFYSILLHPGHAKAPPAFIQVSGLDPLRDEGILYGQVLQEAGVKVKTEIYAGLPHGGHSLLPTLEISKKVNEDFRSALRWICDGAK